MAGQKLSAKAMEEFEFMDGLLKECAHLLGETEKYAGSTGNSAQQIFQGITRQLGHIRQKAMMKNLGPLADAAGVMAIGANRGSPLQRARFLREQLATYKTNIERTMKALVAADAREKAEQEKVAAQRKAASQGS
jgi:hypothetical protein